ncbi:MAG: ribosome biogenesis GTP-binding protein YihA/YsxC [Pseudothermotoga sp.]|uniref:ribosome biogenesis GTP-binding protein YihA/YsxC n=1 Tax=Pseudothermotoga sp. TaxID=2033661 RepID=UPI00258EE011|nr:ribosome biogenesis GTP-binding protein YihA/YsxC [Pseudothermotoga sp.]MDI6862318.1 ribosome biogenesis GTP-binding protein YihA/YsxC [Pseudothermotoga sp.]
MLVKSARFLVAAHTVEQFPEPLKGDVCFAGRSNVGKSTLLNILCNQKLAKVSKTPGKTRTINFYLINERYYFVDLPGYGYAAISKAERQRWKKLIESYFSLRKNEIKLSVLLVDSRLTAQESDKIFVEYCEHYGLNLLIVLSKTDKLSETQLKKVVQYFSDEFGSEVIPYSALNRRGVKEIVERLVKVLE